MNMFKEFDKLFNITEDNKDGEAIAKLETLRRINEPEMSLPGLQRYCESTGRYRKLIIETSESQVATRMFLRANGIEGIKEIKVIKPEPVVQPIPEPVAQPVAVEAPKPLPVVTKLPAKKSGISDAERQRRRDRMKKMWADKKAKIAQQKELKETHATPA